MQAAVFLDRDNTIIHNDGDLGDPAKVRLIQGAASAIASLCGLGYRVVVVTNQGGVARGMYTRHAVEAVHERIRELVQRAANGARIDAFYYCPYHPEGVIEEYSMEHPLRKPQPGMLLQAAEDLRLDLRRSWMIGDQMRDVEAGRAAGCRTVLLQAQAPEVGSMEESAVPEVPTPAEPAAPLAEVESTVAEGGVGLDREDDEGPVQPDVVVRNLIEAVRVIAQQRKPEVAGEIARPALGAKRWDAAAVARLQQQPAPARRQRRPPSEPEPEAEPESDPDAAPAPELDPEPAPEREAEPEQAPADVDTAPSPAAPAAFTGPEGRPVSGEQTASRDDVEATPALSEPDPEPEAGMEPEADMEAGTEAAPPDERAPMESAITGGDREPERDPPEQGDEEVARTGRTTETMTDPHAAPSLAPPSSDAAGHVPPSAETEEPKQSEQSQETMRHGAGHELASSDDVQADAHGTAPPAPSAGSGDMAAMARTLRLILQELRQQRGTQQGDFSYAKMLALVCQMLAGLCLLGALWMGAGEGDENLGLFLRWMGAALIFQGATLSALLFGR